MDNNSASSRVASAPTPEGQGHHVVPVGHISNAHSALDGMHYEAIDADNDVATALRLSTLTQNGQRLVAVVPFHTVTGKPANLIITQDDPS